MRTLTLGTVAVVTALAGFQPAAAQSRARVGVRVEARYGEPEYRDVRYRTPRYKVKNGRGPAFCRNGRGHPVHGRRWCVDKGWAPYRSSRRYSNWIDVRWDDVYLYEPDFRGDRYYGSLPLTEIVGERVHRRLRQHRNRLGLRGRLTARWVDRDRGGVALEVRAGSYPLAELVDFGYDGHVDRVMLRRGY